ncbi:MAG TPA: aminotransferase class V-fold PLP-dependent enzyme, partial [Candidatus Hydrogenedentes bacterium]|nr:aminotransferase class V-fold PLP-dependent enzyme [Candidatus Hydrogenedentota bacterium]
ETTADLAFALLMAAARRVVEADKFTRAGMWRTWSPMLLCGRDIHHATLGIIGLGRAVELRAAEMEAEGVRLRHLRETLKQGIRDRIPDVHFNGHQTDCLPGTLNVSFDGAEGESILLYLDLEGIAVSTGSACASGSLDPSHVLMAIGTPVERAHGSIRMSLGRDNTMEDIEYVLDKLPPIIAKIRDMSTVYKRRK